MYYFKKNHFSSNINQLIRNCHVSQKSSLKEMLILVNENDEKVGEISKIDAHLKERKNIFPHRAFSLFLFTKQDEFVLQRRSHQKIVFPNLLTNACCSHPLVGEEEEDGVGIKKAVIRKTKHELNVEIDLNSIFLVDKILYRADSNENFEEYEMDHVFVSRLEINVDDINYNNDEVSQIKYFGKNKLDDLVNRNPELFTPWFKNIFLNKGENLLNVLNQIEKNRSLIKEIEDNVKIRKDII